jgi:hypothetical protein
MVKALVPARGFLNRAYDHLCRTHHRSPAAISTRSALPPLSRDEYVTVVKKDEERRRGRLELVSTPPPQFTNSTTAITLHPQPSTVT